MKIILFLFILSVSFFESFAVGRISLRKSEQFLNSGHDDATINYVVSRSEEEDHEHQQNVNHVVNNFYDQGTRTEQQETAQDINYVLADHGPHHDLLVQEQVEGNKNAPESGYSNQDVAPLRMVFHDYDDGDASMIFHSEGDVVQPDANIDEIASTRLRLELEGDQHEIIDSRLPLLAIEAVLKEIMDRVPTRNYEYLEADEVVKLRNVNRFFKLENAYLDANRKREEELVKEYRQILMRCEGGEISTGNAADKMEAENVLNRIMELPHLSASARDYYFNEQVLAAELIAPPKFPTVFPPTQFERELEERIDMQERIASMMRSNNGDMWGCWMPV